MQRDEHGRFTASGAAHEIGRQMAASPAGFSWSPEHGAPSSGYMVSRHPNEDRGAVIDLHGEAANEANIAKAVLDHIKSNIDFVRGDPNRYFGGWIDSGKLYLDVSDNIHGSEESAIRAGQDRNQVGIYHIDSGRVINTGGTGEKTVEKASKSRVMIPPTRPKEGESTDDFAKRLSKAVVDAANKSRAEAGLPALPKK